MHEFIPGAATLVRFLLNGEDIYAAADVTKIRLKVGMVFVKPNPFPMTIAEECL
jgi:phosphate transport system ATP-binding protein